MGMYSFKLSKAQQKIEPTAQLRMWILTLTEKQLKRWTKKC